MHPDVTAAELGTCPQCGMKLVASDAPPPPAAEPGQGAARGGHDHGDGLEWEDLMPEINRVSDSGNMIWQLIDRQTGAVNGDISWSFTVGDRVKIRLVNEMDSDHPMHHPFHVHGAGRFLILSRDGKPEANLVWKDTVLLRAGETVDILLDVSNPGLWMAHCHIAEHNQSGMMFSFNVARDRKAGPMTAGPAGTPLDVLVIGGGQAGLAMGYHLAQSGRSFQIVDAGAEIGHVWRSRWDSLRLFTSGRYDNLPGLPFPAAPDAYPGKDDVADYLQAYAAKFNLPVRLDVKVTSLTMSGGGYVAKAGGEELEARQVVVATGPFQVPFIPPIADALDPGVYQIHSAHYRHPQSVPPGKVLVVGAANSGCQIAQELSATHRVGALSWPADPGDSPAAAGPRCVGLGDRAAAGQGDRGLAAGTAAGRAGPGDRSRATPARPAPRHPDPAPRGERGREDGDLRRRQRRGLRRRGVGHRVHGGPLMDRHPRGQGRPGTHLAPTGRDASARPVHDRPHLAAHSRLRAARLGRQ